MWLRHHWLIVTLVHLPHSFNLNIVRLFNIIFPNFVSFRSPANLRQRKNVYRQQEAKTKHTSKRSPKSQLRDRVGVVLPCTGVSRIVGVILAPWVSVALHPILFIKIRSIRPRVRVVIVGIVVVVEVVGLIIVVYSVFVYLTGCLIHCHKSDVLIVGVVAVRVWFGLLIGTKLDGCPEAEIAAVNFGQKIFLAVFVFGISRNLEFSSNVAVVVKSSIGNGCIGVALPGCQKCLNLRQGICRSQCSCRLWL